MRGGGERLSYGVTMHGKVGAVSGGGCGLVGPTLREGGVGPSEVKPMATYAAWRHKTFVSTGRIGGGIRVRKSHAQIFRLGPCMAERLGRDWADACVFVGRPLLHDLPDRRRFAERCPCQIENLHQLLPKGSKGRKVRRDLVTPAVAIIE
jgi:hypothetical protein